MKFNSIEQIVNDNIFLSLDAFARGRNIYLKLEGFNPGGSIKIKTALALIRDAEQRRDLCQKKKMIESSSGNLGLSLSMIAAARGYRFTCVVDANTSKQMISTMQALGTNVIVIDRRDEQGGYLGNRLGYIRDALERDPELIWLNQYQNPANPAVHSEMTAQSIYDEFDHVDYLFVGAGTTGTLMGCAAFFREHSPDTKLIAVDSIGSITFGTPGGRRYLPGLGSSVMPSFFDRGPLDLLVQISEAETVAACRDLAHRYGSLCGASTGTVLAAVRRLAGDLPRDATIVAISPDLGGAYIDTLYNDAWCDSTYGNAWRDVLEHTTETLAYV
ncbi:2,3-diaminopropionate biosynthesis protein SbnA [Paraburkholderia acidicola]|uniref:2,3-diaminopropionate biosynthesis protein SbnA n=1 Tax=Paraburkholderia acidicola TaxID=1912599 RepID=A0A1I9RH08_9BURK|nr:2,3-diaminopropionate biosynthesis protein SbnA [Paraburkholderia acidicola]AOZ21315.1 SulH [Paraburkholderia acidicola]PCE22693.1 2,3-diaminopropionate biosynthesis protein SbnA [Paraburkholderia acidicola]